MFEVISSICTSVQSVLTTLGAGVFNVSTVTESGLQLSDTNSRTASPYEHYPRKHRSGQVDRVVDISSSLNGNIEACHHSIDMELFTMAIRHIMTWIT